MLGGVKAKTDRPAIVNASFNVYGELVRSSADAFRRFMADRDGLAVGHCSCAKRNRTRLAKARVHVIVRAGLIR